LLELALVTPLLLVMFLGVADFGRVLYTAIVLSQAARAGASYGAQTNGTTGDTAGIRDAALSEATELGAIGVTSARICECPGGAVVACNATCAGYGVPRVAVQVTTTWTFETLTVFPGVPDTVNLSRTARVRVQ
jgi:Flp pilus assembly protein TadG